MVQLLDLPIELQFQLIKTCHQSGQKTLTKLSQTNQFYYKSSQRLLKSDINLNESNEEDYNLDRLENLKYNFIPFYRLSIQSISFKFINSLNLRIDETLSEILSLIGLLEKIEILYYHHHDDSEVKKDYQIEENFLNTIESISKLTHLNTLIIKGHKSSNFTSSQSYPQVSLILNHLNRLKNLQTLTFDGVEILVLPIEETKFEFEKGSIELKIIDCKFTLNSINFKDDDDEEKSKIDQVLNLNLFLKSISTSLNSLNLIHLKGLESHLNFLQFELPFLKKIEFEFLNVKEETEELGLEKIQGRFNQVCFTSLIHSHQLMFLKINLQLDLNYLFSMSHFFQFQQILYS
ncbi:hypothetical protein DFH28DRAFT_224634 [Melampsora americana]|nr:hypothetical protein DFH28DRAFT_224634 [Melampsora americana]